MNRINKILLTLILVITLNGVVQSQTVVILNGIPTKVQLEGDKIIAILQEVPNYLAGYSDKATTIQFGSESHAVEGAIVNASIANESATTTEEALSNPVTTQTTSVSKSEVKKASVGNYFKFSGNSALLSEMSINEIQDYAEKIKQGEASTVTLESFYRANSTRSEQLVNNRLDACKKYFELSGVSADRITIKNIADKNQSNKVAVILN